MSNYKIYHKINILYSVIKVNIGMVSIILLF